MRHAKASETVLLSESEAAPELLACLTPETGPATWYPSVAEMVRRQELSTVSLLVLDFHRGPKGVQLAALGRMKGEYPGMQKVAVLHQEPPLPVVEYLTSCGVDLVWNGGETGLERLASAVHRSRERIPWIAS